MLYRMKSESVEAETARFLESVAELAKNRDAAGMAKMFDGWSMPPEWEKPIAEMTYMGREQEPEMLRTIITAVTGSTGPKDVAFFERLMDSMNQPDNGVPRMKSRMPRAELSLSTETAEEPSVRAATLYDDTLHMAHKEGDDGLIYKAICKTGTLALSPGPGQIDVEEPLELTPDLFGHLVESVEEKAFPYITVPKSHENSMMENTGFVRKLSIEESTDPNDAPGTKVLWAGIQFTEPDIKEKIMRGTIPDTSVGVKFNYRNKRTGKLYPAALEHVALTHQPWVDGLTPFGSEQLLSLSADTSLDEKDYMGVFTNKPPARAARSKRRASSRPASTSKRREGDILPSRKSAGGISPQFHASNPEREMGKTETTTKPSVEKLLASQQARIEKAERENDRLRRKLDLAQESISSSAAQLHESEVRAKVAKWQDDGVPPAVCAFAHEVLLAVGPTDDSKALNLSVTKTTDEGEEVVEESLSLSAIVEQFVDRVPKVGSGDIGKIVAEMDRLNMSQTDGQSGLERGAEMYEQTKKRVEGR